MVLSGDSFEDLSTIFFDFSRSFALSSARSCQSLQSLSQENSSENSQEIKDGLKKVKTFASLLPTFMCSVYSADAFWEHGGLKDL
jgi:hypothetical protein